MNEVLCSKKDCPHKLSCQHGKPHKRLENCEALSCGFGGNVECRPVEVKDGEK